MPADLPADSFRACVAIVKNESDRQFSLANRTGDGGAKRSQKPPVVGDAIDRRVEDWGKRTNGVFLL